MGTFRTLYATLPCSQCRKAIPTDIQFKTGNDGSEKYSEGEVISAKNWPDAAMEYEGLFDVACDKCFFEWRMTLILTEYEVLMELIREGRLTMRLKTTGETLTPERLPSFANDALRDIDQHSPTTVFLLHASEPSPIHRHGSALGKFELEFDGASRNFADQAFDDLVRDRTDLKMKEKGWSHGSDWMSKVIVYLDNHRRIRCRLN